jgi:digeranylgeranylglycerophospholipid reductase
MHKSTKIVIVGAGPIGCYTAQLLKHQGYEPILLEEHAEIGKPIQCAGIVGNAIFKDLRLNISKKSILNVINGANIHFNESSFRLKRPKVAYVIDREIFDKELAKGLNIEFNTLLREIHEIKDGYLLNTSNGEYYADLVVGADGPNSRVRQSLGFSSDIKSYPGFQYRVKMSPKEQNFVEVHYIKPFSLFTWVIPEGNGTIRIGTISESPYQELKKFFEKHDFRPDVVEKNSGLVPMGVCQLVKGNAALVGDAACQIKSITAGGLYYGMKAAELLADAVKERNLSRYERKWKEEFGREIKICLLARDIMENMEEKVLDNIFSFVKENSSLIEKIADYENHSSVLLGLISNPRTYKAIGALLIDAVKNPRFVLGPLMRALR